MTLDGSFSRAAFLRRVVAGALTVLGGSWPVGVAEAKKKPKPKPKRRPKPKPKPAIEHLVVSCQENRSFDHYFGYAPQVQALGYGPPGGFSQPDAAGVTHAPFEFSSLS